MQCWEKARKLVVLSSSSVSDKERPTPYDFTCTWNLRNKTNKPTKQNRLIDAENRLIVARGEGLGGLGEKVKGLGSSSWFLQNSHRDVKYSIGNTVSNSVITMNRARRGLEISGVTL